MSANQGQSAQPGRLRDTLQLALVAALFGHVTHFASVADQCGQHLGISWPVLIQLLQQSQGFGGLAGICLLYTSDAADE